MNTLATRVSGVRLMLFLFSASIVQSEPAKVPDPVIGRWRWIENQIVVCKADNKFSVIPSKRTGSWKVLPGKTLERKYAFTWDDGLFVDTLTMSRDENTLKGKNKQGKKIEARKIE